LKESALIKALEIENQKEQDALQKMNELEIQDKGREETEDMALEERQLDDLSLARHISDDTAFLQNFLDNME